MSGLLGECGVRGKAAETIFVLTAKCRGMSLLEGDIKVADKPEIAVRPVY
jgi:hypothetical protein